MRTNFQQGIISYPASGPLQVFLLKTGVYVSLSTVNGRTDITFAHGESNYLYTESADVTNAWGPIPANTDVWLYWDIDLQSAVRTFGFTLLQPQYGTTYPLSPTQGQHFFDTAEKKMYLYDMGTWREVVRVFAAKVNNSTFTALGSNNPLKPFAGTQVGLNVQTVSGRILVDDTGMPIRRQDGRFFTSEDDIFMNGSPANTIRLEANVLTGTALENMAAYHVVKFSQFGKIELCEYDDLQQEAIAMLMEDLNYNETGTVITQGTITNPDWNWQNVGAELWVSTSGQLIEGDPHVIDNITYPTGRPPVGRVITPTTIFFDQGLGGKGETGPAGPEANVDLATNVIFGIVKLSLAAANPANPIVVGDNDPRNSDARVPLPHNQAATTITFTPYGALTAINVQTVLEQVENQKLSKSGGTMTGALTLYGAPTNPLHAATKQYVDNMTLNGLQDVTLLSPTAGNVLYFDGGVWTEKDLALDDLTDVDLTTTPPSPGDYLSFDGTNWVTYTPSSSSLALNDLTDVEATAHTQIGALNSGENAWLRWDTGLNLWVSEVGMPYDMHFYLPSKASGIANIVMGSMVSAREVVIPTNFVGSYAWCETPTLLFDPDVIFTVYVNNVPWVDVTFADNTNAGTFNVGAYTPTYTINAGDRVTVKPQGVNLTIEDVSITIVGCTTKLTC